MLETTLNSNEQLKNLDWPLIEQTLDEEGYAILPALLSTEECSELVKLYDFEQLFRSKIDMARYQFGQGEYKYLAYPLPPLVEELRNTFYRLLAPLANNWSQKLGLPTSYPAELASFLEMCQVAGQTKPTPLILHYQAGDYNCLHQDLYGEFAFPFQVVFGLSQCEVDYSGGELLLVEQRPRAQSRGQVIRLEQGQGLIFANRYRPISSKRGYYRANLRHGVSRLDWGNRYALGLIFHDAK